MIEVRATPNQREDSAIGVPEALDKPDGSGIGVSEAPNKRANSGIGVRQTADKQDDSATGVLETPDKRDDSVIGVPETPNKQDGSGIGLPEAPDKRDGSAISLQEVLQVQSGNRRWASCSHQAQQRFTHLGLPFAEVGEAGLQDLQIAGGGGVAIREAGVEGREAGEQSGALILQRGRDFLELLPQAHFLGGEEGFGERGGGRFAAFEESGDVLQRGTEPAEKGHHRVVDGHGTPGHLVELEEVLEAFFRRLQRFVGGVDLGGACGIAAGLVGMRGAAGGEPGLLQGVRVEGGGTRQAEEGEGVRHRENQAEKLSPQEQVTTALGFFTLKPPLCRSSL